MRKETISHKVWVWGQGGQKTLSRGTREKCRTFRRDYKGYRQEDMYITKIEITYA